MKPGEYIPKAGDFVFFDWYRTNPGRGGHTGIVTSCEQNADGSYTVHTIEGNVGYDIGYGTILERMALE